MAIERRLSALARLALAAGLLGMVLGGLGAQSAATPITEQNWINHPLIKEIRVLFNETEQSITARRLVRIPLESQDAQAWGLDTHHVRKLSVQTGGEDSAISYDHYYDPAGTLRFAFVRANAVNGTSVEYRIYFNERGERIWDNRKHTAGPGYTFPDLIPVEWLVTDSLSLSVVLSKRTVFADTFRGASGKSPPHGGLLPEAQS